MKRNKPQELGSCLCSRRYRVVASVVIGLILLTGISITAFSGLSVTPLLLDFTMDPGSSHSGKLTVQNTGDSPLKVVSQVYGFKASDNGVAHFLSETAAQEYPYSGEDLLSLEPAEVVLGPGEKKEFIYNITYPEKPEPFGGRYVGALFKALPPEKGAEKKASQITVATRVGTLMLVRPSEEILIGKDFEEFEVDPKIADLSAKTVYEGSRLLISTLLKNAGNIHIRKKEFDGKLTVAGPDGSVLKEISISPHNILPDTDYALNELWKIPEGLTADEKKEYTVSVQINIKTPYDQIIQVKRSTKIKL